MGPLRSICTETVTVFVKKIKGAANKNDGDGVARYEQPVVFFFLHHTRKKTFPYEMNVATTTEPFCSVFVHLH